MLSQKYSITALLVAYNLIGKYIICVSDAYLVLSAPLGV